MDISNYSAVEIEGTRYYFIESSEVLEATGKQGKKWWQAHLVMDEQGIYYTTTSAYHETSLGNVSTTMWAVPRQARAKNVGRSNETSNEQQARAEYESMVTLEKRLRSGDRIMPMLAATLIDKLNPKKSKRSKIKYPCVVQPKYDGKRLLSDGVVGWSRGNKDTNPETVAHIFPIDTEGMILDGELLLPWEPGVDEAPKVSEVMSAVNKFHPGVSDTLIYMVYDIADLTLTYDERLAKLVDWFNRIGHHNPHIHLALGYKIQSEKDGLAMHAALTEWGYEGSIWRNLDGMYADGKRVTDLQKHKDFITEEFRVKRVVPQGEGIAARRAKFECVTEAGVEFESNAVGSEATQMAYLDNADAIPNMWAVVKYRELTVYGAPFHSNTLELRMTRSGGF